MRLLGLQHTLQLKTRRRDLFWLDQTDAEGANGVFARGGRVLEATAFLR
jgi:hypothetical protein